MHNLLTISVKRDGRIAITVVPALATDIPLNDLVNSAVQMALEYDPPKPPRERTERGY